MTGITDRNTIPIADSYSLPRLLFRKFVHWASYRFILSSPRTRNVRIADLRLTVPPTVFHPGIFLTSRMFAKYVRCADFRCKTVAEVGTGSGVLALSAALAGASAVLALDINPAAVAAAANNAEANGLSDTVETRLSNLFDAVDKNARFDVIISSPPSFAGEPRDMADRAWHAGPGYRDLQPLLAEAYAHLNDDGEMILLLSSDSNLALIEHLAKEAGFDWKVIARKSIGVEAFFLFHLGKGRPVGSKQFWLPSRAELQAAQLRRQILQKIRKLETLAADRVALETSPCNQETTRSIDHEMQALTRAVVCENYLWQARERLRAAKSQVNTPVKAAQAH
jgi:release factor glutamine methyltransferase